MTLLTALGTASFVFVVVFTYRAYYATHTVGQSPRSSVAEAWMNIVIGFGINFMANMALLPLVNASFTAGENFMLGWIYTAVSIVRQYAIRRWWNARLHALAILIK
jgi:hypothetical protein